MSGGWRSRPDELDPPQAKGTNSFREAQASG